MCKGARSDPLGRRRQYFQGLCRGDFAGLRINYRRVGDRRILSPTRLRLLEPAPFAVNSKVLLYSISQSRSEPACHWFPNTLVHSLVDEFEFDEAE